MLRFLIQAAGFLALAGAFVLAVEDGARSLANGALSLTPLGGSLVWLGQKRVEAVFAALSRLSPKLGEVVLNHVLWVPTSLTLLLLGAALAGLASRRRRR